MAKGRESGSASALFNMMRNIGGSIGIAGLSTLLSVRERFHSARIGASVTIYSGAVQERLQQSATYFMSQRPIFGSHARNRRSRSPPGLPARIQRLFPGAGLCVALKRNCSILLYEKNTYPGRGCGH
jgi:hypothetical protein